MQLDGPGEKKDKETARVLIYLSHPSGGHPHYSIALSDVGGQGWIFLSVAASTQFVPGWKRKNSLTLHAI